eukprot:gene29923-17992_t
MSTLPGEDFGRSLWCTIVSYCSQEREYIESLLVNAVKYSDFVVVSIGERLYSGQLESVEELSYIAKVCARVGASSGKSVLTVKYPVSDADLLNPYVLHNLARQTAFHEARSYTGYRPFWAFLLDADEVPDGDALRAWSSTHRDKIEHDGSHVMYKMGNYWAFMHPCLVSMLLQDSIVLVHSNVLGSPRALTHKRERDGIADAIISGGGGVVVRRNVLSDGIKGGPLPSTLSSCNGQAMFWHYSWVRTSNAFSSIGGLRDGLLGKVRNWGHSVDRDWVADINNAFDEVERTGKWPGTDFVHGIALTPTTTLKPPFEIKSNTPHHLHLDIPSPVAIDDVKDTDVGLRRVVHVYQRHCSCSPSSVHKRRPDYFDRRGIFASLLRDVSRDARVASFVIAYDDTTGSLASHFVSDILKDHEGYDKGKVSTSVARGGDDASALRNLFALIERHVKEGRVLPNDVVYLLEDDYAHREGWVGALLEGFDVLGDTPGYVTLYDHPDKYNLPMYRDLQSCVLHSKSLHWRTTPSTTNTFACLAGTLMSHLPLQLRFCSLPGPADDHGKFLALMKEKHAPLISAIPAFATHVESNMLSPTVSETAWESFCGFKIK